MTIMSFSDDFIDLWLAMQFTAEVNKSILRSQKFQENNKERETVGATLQNLYNNDGAYEDLKKFIYNCGVADDYRILDNTDGHDPITFFCISIIYVIFRELEDSPIIIDTSSNENFKLSLLNEIEFMAKSLLQNNSQKIYESSLSLFNIVENLQKEQKAIEVENVHYNNEKVVSTDKKFLYKQFLLHLWDTKFQKIDINNLFDFDNEGEENLERIIDSIYYYISNNNCDHIVGIEKSGVPIVSLIAYEFNFPFHILRTNPLYKVMPKLPQKGKVVLFDNIAISETTIKPTFPTLNHK